MMKNSTHQAVLSTALLSIAAALILTACGGGDSSTDEVAGGSATAQANPDAFVGRYSQACAISGDATDANNKDLAVYKSTRVTVQPKTASDLYPIEFAASYYSTQDCSGTPRHTLTTTGGTVRMDGRMDLAGKAVFKITETQGNPFPGIKTAKLVVNGLNFGAVGQVAQPSKDIWHLDADGRLYLGDDSKPVDAQGYPTALQTTAAATKT